MAAAQQARLRPDDRLDLRADPGDRADLRRRGNGPVLLAVVLLLLVAAGLGGYLWWADWSPTGATPASISFMILAASRMLASGEVMRTSALMQSRTFMAGSCERGGTPIQPPRRVRCFSLAGRSPLWRG